MKKLFRPADVPEHVVNDVEVVRAQLKRATYSHCGRKYSLFYHAERLRKPSTVYGVDSAVKDRQIRCLIECDGKPAAYLTFTQYRFATPEPDCNADEFLFMAADAHSQALIEIVSALSRKTNIEEILWHGDILECTLAYTLPGQATDGFWIAGARALLSQISGLGSATLAFELFPIEYAWMNDREDGAELVPAFQHRQKAMRRLHARSLARYFDVAPDISVPWTFISLENRKKRGSRHDDRFAA